MDLTFGRGKRTRIGGRMSVERRESIAGWLFVSPWVVGFIIFGVGPLVASLLLGFAKWDGLGASPKWLGLFNYNHIFTRNVDFAHALGVTFRYALMVLPTSLVLSLGLALLLNMKIRGINLFRTLLYLPSVLPAVAVVMLWSWIFQPDFGLLNYLLGLVGIEGPAWFSSTTWALPALAIMSFWGIGGGAIIYLAGLQNIAPVLYEAATIDGANRWNSFWRITLPLLSPTIFYNVVLGLIMILQTFTTAFVGTGGGPRKATLFYMLLIYNSAFRSFRMGYASALAWILALIILILTIAIFKSSDVWVFHEAEVGRGE